MKVYVAGSLSDVGAVQEIQATVIAAGHDVVLDWTRAADIDVSDYASNPVESGRVALEDLRAVLAADAVLVVVSEHSGRGMFVELGAALCRAEQGDLEQVVVIGSVRHDSVFYYHPAVRRWSTVDEWLMSLTRNV